MALFLALDLSVTALRGVITNENYTVVWSSIVSFDQDCKEYGTRGGCHAFGDEITSPSEMHIRALDLLFSRMEGRHLTRIVGISGSAQQHTAVYLSASAQSKLTSLQNTPSSQLLQHLSPFTTLPNSPNSQDTSTASQARELNRAFTGDELIWRTGGRVYHRYTALQLMKLRQTKPQVLSETSHVLLLSTWLTSLFTGQISPTDEADACATGLWNVQERKWDDKIANVVLGDFKNADGITGETLVNKWFGNVKRWKGESAGAIAPYFVSRYNIAPDCKVYPFTGDVPSTVLSFTLSPTDAIISLGVGDADNILVPINAYKPTGHHQVFPHSAGSEGIWITSISYKDASMARNFVRDIYCNQSWDMFNNCVNQVAPGGSIGLDDKLFSFFYPHGELGVWQGISRFERGQRVAEYGNRSANPRAILESQFLSMRIRLSTLLSSNSQSPPKDNNDHSVLPQRIIVVGPTSENVTILQTLSNVLGAPVFKAASCAGFPGDPSTPGISTRRSSTSGNGEEDRENGEEEIGTSAAALGSAYKIRWAHHLGIHRDDTHESFEAYTSRQFRSKAPTIQPQGNNAIEGIQLSRLPSSQSTSLTVPSISSPSAPPPAAISPGSLIVPIVTDEKDTLLGLKKVAEPDEDAFKFYGAMIEEFVRLEGFVQKGLL